MTANPIYLQIHYTLTKQAIAAHIHKYNQDIEKEFAENPDAFREKYCLSKKSTYKSVIVKASVEATVLSILDMYAKFLQRNENTQSTEPVFKITNKAVVTKRNGLLCKKTAHLHIKRATDAGIFDKNKYVFHGTNSGFEISFNPCVLAACMNPVFTEMIVENYINSVDKPLITDEKLTLLSAIRPLFSDSNNGYIVTNCNYIIVPEPLQEPNINMDEAVIVENNLLPQIFSTNNQIFNGAVAPTGTIQEQGSIHKPFDLNAIALNFLQRDTKKQEQKFRPSEREKATPTIDIDLLLYYISYSLKLILNVLYKDRTISDADLALASKDLNQYFRREKAGKSMAQLSDDLWLAVMEAHKSQRRNGFTPAPLHKYLDVYFKGGLLSTTLEHVEKNVKPYIEKNKDITQSIEAANQWYQLFVKSGNNTEVYRKATQNLNKKKNKTYLDFFNEAVIEHKNFNKQIIYQTTVNQ